MKNRECNICPRHCNVDRSSGERGYCGAGPLATVSHISRHFFEEPPISGTKGSGTVFFGGCNMRCVFCQNKVISGTVDGRDYDFESLAELFIEVAESGVENINLVTPTPHLKTVIPALRKAKPNIKIPVVYNTSSYESPDMIDELSDLIDVYLPDLKYFSEDLSSRYSNAEKYFKTASEAIEKMLSKKPCFSLREDGILASGVIVRHLVLPTHRKDSEQILEHLASFKEKYDFRLSLMSQYTPDFLGEDSTKFKEIARRITTLEYNRILDKAISLGFQGYFQDRESAKTDYTPDFDTKKFKEGTKNL